MIEAGHGTSILVPSSYLLYILPFSFAFVQVALQEVADGKRRCPACNQLRTARDRAPDGQIHQVLGQSNKFWCPYIDYLGILQAFEKEQKDPGILVEANRDAQLQHASRCSLLALLELWRDGLLFLGCCFLLRCHTLLLLSCLLSRPLLSTLLCPHTVCHRLWTKWWLCWWRNGWRGRASWLLQECSYGCRLLGQRAAEFANDLPCLFVHCLNMQGLRVLLLLPEKPVLGLCKGHRQECWR